MDFKNIILIGPMAVGKTTTGKYFSEKNNIEFVEIDSIRNKYFQELDYNHSEALKIYDKNGIIGLTTYWKPYELHTIIRSMEDYKFKLFDFGAGFSMFEGDDLSKVKESLKDCFKILLLPSRNSEKGLFMTLERIKSQQNLSEISDELMKFTIQSLKHPGHIELADTIIYVEEKSTEDLCNEIQNVLNLKHISLDKYK